MSKLTPPNPNQFSFFESSTAASVERPPRLELPIQVSNTIDPKRASKILGISTTTVHRMIKRKLFVAYRLLDNSNAWRIDYDSVVEYCNRLRVHYGISDSRSPLNGRKRRRDEDILPFPLQETIFIDVAMRTLDCCKGPVVSLIQCGKLTAYQLLIEEQGCPWRIQASSLREYVASLHQAAGARRPSTLRHA